ncbi:MAG: hypothetical protein NVS1B10_08460 [Candidatus Saccharimonadales bacterium]
MSDKQPNETKIVTTGNTVKIELPDGKKRRKPRVSVVDGADEFVGGFVEFLRERAVVGLAVGFVIGTQAQVLVKQLVASFIDPAFTLLFGQALSQRTFTLHFHTRLAHFAWGALAYAVLNFLFVLFAIYLIIKFFKLDRLDQKKDK